MAFFFLFPDDCYCCVLLGCVCLCIVLFGCLRDPVPLRSFVFIIIGGGFFTGFWFVRDLSESLLAGCEKLFIISSPYQTSIFHFVGLCYCFLHFVYYFFLDEVIWQS